MEVVTNNWFTKKYPIGFALSGGFIKGFAHLGAMQSLLEHDIKPNILSGVSAGALAGVFYADGNEPHKVLDYFAGHKFQDLTKLVIPKVGLFELGEFIDFLKSNLSPLMATKYKMNIVSIALRSYNFMFRSNSFPEREKADLLIEPYNLEGYSNTELEKAEEIFMQGYNTTNDILERLLIDKGSIWKE